MSFKGTCNSHSVLTANSKLLSDLEPSDTIFGIPNRLHTISQELATIKTASETQVVTWNEQPSILHTVSARLTRLQDDCAAIRESVQAAPLTIVSKEDEMKQMLRQILENIASLSLQGKTSARVDEIRENSSGECSLDQENVDENQPCAKLMTAIS